MSKKENNNLKNIPDADYEKLLDSIMNDPELAELENNDKSNDSNEKNENKENAALTKWSISELNDLTDEFSSEKLSDDSVDEKLLLALGYLSQSEDADLLDRTVKIKEQVFGLKKEFSDVREIPSIKKRFQKEKQTLRLRLISTLAIALLIFLYPFVSSLLRDSFSFFNTDIFFRSNMFAVLQLLLIAAAFSGRDLFKGFIKIFLLRPNIYSPSALMILSVSLFEIAFAFLAKDTSASHVSMYCLPAVISLILPIVSDIMRMTVQENTFDRINAHATENTDVFHLSESESGIILEKNGKDIDFYKRTRMQHSDPKIMNFTLIPGFVLSVVIGLYIFFSSGDTASAINTASICICIILPSAGIMNYLPFFSVSSSVLNKADTSVIGRSSVIPLSECECITVSEKDIFEPQKGNYMTMDMYEIDKFFDVFYYGACVLRHRDSPLANLFLASAESLELSEDVEIKHSDSNGISALVDGNSLIRLGNRKYVESFGIDLPEKQRENTDSSRAPSFVLYIVKNDVLLASSDIYYTPSKDFMRVAEMIKSNNMKLRILSSDFVTTKELVKSMFSLDDDEFELVKTANDKNDSNKRSSLAVSLHSPAPLFAMQEICSTVRSAEAAIHSCSIFTSIISAIAAVMMAVLSFTSLSPYSIILFNIIMLLPSFVMAKLYTSRFTQHM